MFDYIFTFKCVWWVEKRKWFFVIFECFVIVFLYKIIIFEFYGRFCYYVFLFFIFICIKKSKSFFVIVDGFFNVLFFFYCSGVGSIRFFRICVGVYIFVREIFFEKFIDSCNCIFIYVIIIVFVYIVFIV